MTGKGFTEQHRRCELAVLALAEARLRGDDEAVRALATTDDPGDWRLIAIAAIEALATTLRFRCETDDAPYRQIAYWRQSILRRPTTEEFRS